MMAIQPRLPAPPCAALHPARPGSLAAPRRGSRFPRSASLRAAAILLSWVAVACSTAMHSPAPEPARPLRLLAAGATEASVRDQIAGFEHQTGLAVESSFGAVGALRDQVLAGVPADVVIVTPAIIAALSAHKLVRAGSRVDLGQVGGGLAVKVGAPAPAIATVEQFKQALLDADEVYYADPATATAGAALIKVAETLGIADQVRSKGRIAPGGKEAMKNLARSTAARAVGVTQISEIASVPEVQLVGEYPGALQVKTTYTAIVLERTRRPEDAQKLVQFLAGPAFQARLARSGFEPALP
jgi:molybdate transport system substrate-binding protein